MSDTLSTQSACDLDSVIATSELPLRESRRANPELENRALMQLTQALAKSPRNFFQTLVESVLELSKADSAGISLLDEEQKRFVWPAVAGGLTPYLGEGTPREFGPCGTVLDRNAPILFIHPERHFGYLAPILPPLEEVLLIPFHWKGKAVGTIWAVIHQKGRKFDREDKRLLESLSEFASRAYEALAEGGALTPLMGRDYYKAKSV